MGCMFLWRERSVSHTGVRCTRQELQAVTLCCVLVCSCKLGTRVDDWCPVLLSLAIAVLLRQVILHEIVTRRIIVGTATIIVGNTLTLCFSPHQVRSVCLVAHCYCCDYPVVFFNLRFFLSLSEVVVMCPFLSAGTQYPLYHTVSYMRGVSWLRSSPNSLVKYARLRPSRSALVLLL